MQIRMAMMAPVPRPAAATAPRAVQSPCSSHGHTFTLITERLESGGLPESDTEIGTSYTPDSRNWILRLRRAKSPVDKMEFVRSALSYSKYKYGYGSFVVVGVWVKVTGGLLIWLWGGH